MGREVLLASFADDFYYYLKISTNLYSGKGLSFFEGVLTNGFQPVHQLLVIIVDGLAQLLRIDELILLRSVFGLLFTAFSYLFFRVLQPSGFFSSLSFITAICSYFILSTTGMEVLLLVPVMVLFLLRLKDRRAGPWEVLSWLLLLFLIRIDSVIIGGLIAAWYMVGLIKDKIVFYRELVSPMIAGIVFLSAWFFINDYYFGSMLPISGLAKSVRYFSGINSATFNSIVNAEWTYRSVILAPVLGGIALVLITRKYERLQVIALVLIGIYYLQNAIRSDWKIWSWYFFPFTVWMLFISNWFEQYDAKIVSSIKQGVGSIMLYIASLWTIGAVLFITLGFISPANVPSTLNEAASRIKLFEKEHKGVYAMGDRAGIVGYALESPLVQLEGLVMDRRFLERLHHSSRLGRLLEYYKVDYYIATNPVELGNGRYQVDEPRQSNRWKITDTINWPVEAVITVKKDYRFRKRLLQETRTFIFSIPRGTGAWHGPVPRGMKKTPDLSSKN